jgi:hypothetical protein
MHLPMAPAPRRFLLPGFHPGCTTLPPVMVLSRAQYQLEVKAIGQSQVTQAFFYSILRVLSVTCEHCQSP